MPQNRACVSDVWAGQTKGIVQKTYFKNVPQQLVTRNEKIGRKAKKAQNRERGLDEFCAC